MESLLELELDLIQDAMEEPEAPLVANAEVRGYLAHRGHWAEVPEEVVDWVARRKEILAVGADLIAVLEERHPTPNFWDVAAGTANFPPWHGSEAWQTLCFRPWAENYEKALETCQGYLDE